MISKKMDEERIRIYDDLKEELSINRETRNFFYQEEMKLLDELSVYIDQKKRVSCKKELKCELLKILKDEPLLNSLYEKGTISFKEGKLRMAITYGLLREIL